ncbi:ketopantoate reductase family protein [Neobacillus sp. LXY-1]|uniref:ketopantoate reductase family protein n=1 Tax=Neobacillus sp. LXY-1 TaxID=3379133 RepID=UPI003EE02D17
MRILVVGAGAVGGYFGGRLLEKGEDVTFLVREGRRNKLKDTGLAIESVHGNAILFPNTMVAGEDAEPFSLIILSTKAYHLNGAIESIRRYVGKDTMILPLLNGLLHYDKLAAEFGAEKVIGGLCFIESTLDKEGRVIQTSTKHDIVFGELNGVRSERISKVEAAFSGTKTGYRLSENISQDLWNKYLFIAVMSGITTLMRAPIGPIRELPEGKTTMDRLLQEIISVMKSAGAPFTEDIQNNIVEQINGLGFEMKSSMQRDMEKTLPVEADHLQGYLLEMARKDHLQVPVLESVYANLKIYEKQLLV